MSLRFPLFIDVEGKPVIVVGGGRIGAHRARVLREFGAVVTIISPTLAVPVEGAVHLARPYACGDLQGAFLAVAATDCREVNHQVGLEARALGIPVSVADCREECTFFFPALCTGHGVIAGVSGDGGDHRNTAEAARRIRRTLEEWE